MPQTIRRPARQLGFTLVEAIIVIVVLFAILAISAPMIREQREKERQRLQALADTEPWEFFEFLAEPAKDSFAIDELIVIRCAIENRSKYTLSLPKIGAWACRVNFRDAGFSAVSQTRLPTVIPDASIPGGKSVEFEVRFHLRFVSDGTRPTRIEIALTPDETAGMGGMGQIENQFHSNEFRLVVEPGDGTFGVIEQQE